MEEKVKIDLRILLAEAIAYNPKTYLKIDEIFNNNKQYYLEILKKYEKEILPFCIYSLKQDDYIRKFFSIFYSAVEENNTNDQENVYEIIKTGWYYVYQYVKTNKNIDIDNFLKKFVKKNKVFTNNQLNTSLYILLILSIWEGIHINNFDEHQLIQHIFIHGASNDSVKFSKEKFYSNLENKNLIKDIRNKYFKYIGLKKFNIDDFINNSKLHKYNNLYAFIHDIENIDSYIIFNIDMNEEDIDDLIIYYILSQNQSEIDLDNLKINYEDLNNFINANLSLKIYIKAFKQAKEYYRQNNQDLFLHDILKINNELNIEKNKNEKLLEEINKLKEEIREKDNIIRKLQLLNSEYEKNKKELIALRSYIFENKQENENKNENIEDEKSLTEIIKNKNIVNKKILIVGGNKWVNKFKEYLPNAIIITDDNINFDVKILNNVEYVFIYTRYLSHALYYKIISNIKNKNNIQLYLLPYQNIEQNILYLLDKIC